MTTTYFLAEQVILNLKGGKYQAASSVQIEDVIAYMRSILPGIVKAEWFQNTMQGETIPDNLYISPFHNVAVLQTGNRYYSKLPFMPISLPRNMGVYSIYDPEDPYCEFIPVRSGLWGFVKNNGTISDLFGQIAYSVDGPEITYHMNPKKATVSMKLMVPDITSLGDNDLLPIGSDHEALLLQKAFEWFANQRPPGLRIDPSTDTQFLQK